MTMLTIGSLFSGYGGLDLACETVFDARTAWVSDIDPGACNVLAHRFPHAPNLGDITAIDWSTVEPVDIIAGGTPCQDLSTAGRRAGMTSGTRSNLWAQMREAIAHVQPTFVVWENVRGALSANASSSLEHCPGCMGDSRHGGPVLRALGRVLGDLADLGYDAQWHGLRAADVGACHGRFRVFLLAWRCQRTKERVGNGNGFGTPLSIAVRLLPTPRAQARENPYAREDYHHSLEEWAGHYEAGTLHMLPTPRATRGGSATETAGLLPTPVADNSRGLPSTGTDFQSLPNEVVHRWGEYAAAIARHEQALGRPAPAPTEPGPKGNPRLSPAFVEWMMMLPAGWITDVPGVTRTDALRACGNGVVPPQAVAALRIMLDRAESLGVTA